MLKSLSLISFSIILLIFSNVAPSKNEVQKKILRNGDYDIECYVSLKEGPSFDEDKLYHWYKSGEIHTSRYGAGGYVLHKTYSKFYKSNQLVEQGEFFYGLKNGIWKTWFRNGQLKETMEWYKGEKSGDYVSYDSLGNAIEKGRFRKNQKTGSWINLQTKDTIVYKKGDVFVKEEKPKKDSFFKRLFKKKDDKAKDIAKEKKKKKKRVSKKKKEKNIREKSQSTSKKN